LPRQTEHSDPPNTLPLPELNPLLNPLLGQNMGRWAEVYFTSPPEKREEAVLELLRELQGDDSRGKDAVGTSRQSVQEQGSVQAQAQDQASKLIAAPAGQIAEVQQTLERCPACGHENPTSHRFCGMCGRSVTEQKSVADLEIADFHIEDAGQDQDKVQDNQSQFAPREDAAYEPALGTSESPLFRSRDKLYRDDQADEIFHYPPASRSYRVHVGIAAAIVIFALSYLAWRSMQVTSQSAHLETAPPAAATEPATATPAPSSTSKPDMPGRTPSANQQAAVPSNTDPSSAGSSSAETGARSSGREAANVAPPTNPPTEKNPLPATFGGNGAEELATAQRYLNGDGQERNHAEAAKWLWKAVAKHNAEATFLLSDLYVKGDGVAKNCDQARVLLDAAARKGKGTKDAAARLRHLQAFGCE
jgi:TPR repeat protein